MAAPSFEKGSGMRKAQKRASTVIEKPFVYGSLAQWLGKQSDENQHSHRWTVYVRGMDNEDLSYFIKKVTFQLHSDFDEPLRTIEQAPFEVTETGWGEFSVPIKIYFHDSREQAVQLVHQLKLFPESGQVPSPNKPVVVETYDEFIFVDPVEHFHRMLISGPPRKLVNPNDEHLSTAYLRDQEQKHLQKLAASNATINQQILQLRKRLYELDEEAKGNPASSQVADMDSSET